MEHEGKSRSESQDPVEYSKSWGNFWRLSAAVGVGAVIGGVTTTLINSVVSRSTESAVGAAAGAVGVGGAFSL